MAKIQKKKNIQKSSKKEETKEIAQTENVKVEEETKKEVAVVDNFDDLEHFVVDKKAKTNIEMIKGDNFFAKTIRYFQDVLSELKKITWPDKKQVLASTGVVIVLIIIISIFLGLNDYLLSSLIRLVLK